MEKIPVVQDYTPPYARDGKFHVRLTEGRFQTLRRLSSWPMIALFFGLVWVQVDGQPLAAVLVCTATDHTVRPCPVLA
jgi:hypothetical protein